MPILLECIGPDLKEAVLGLSITPKTKHILLRLATECEGNRDLVLKAGKVARNIKFDDDDDAPKKGKKKRKKSAYNMFIGECVKERAPNTPVAQQMKVCGPRWKGMDDGTKARYQTIADEANE